MRNGLDKSQIKSKSFNVKKIVIRVLLSLLLLMFAYFGWSLYENSLTYEVTDNAYVGANVLQVSSRISGQILQIPIVNNQSVKKGDLLFGLDDEPYRVTIKQHQAKLNQSTQNVSVDLSAISIARSRLDETKVQLGSAKLTASRQEELARKNFLSPQALDNSKAAVALAEAGVRQAEAELVQTGQKVKSVDTKNPAVQESIADLEQARLNLKYSKAYSPVDGSIANLTARPGTYVQAGQPLFAIIDDHNWWVDANFKETQLEGVVPGQLAKIRLSRCPKIEFNGVVESISGGTGASFSLLPAQNANGNWVKVTQRIPVRIRFTQRSASCPFIIGASAEARVILR